MKTAVYIILTLSTLFIASCNTNKSNKFSDIQIPSMEKFLTKFIDFINDGMKYDDFKKICITDADLLDVFNDKANPEYIKVQKKFNKEVSEIKNSWDNFDFSRTQDLTPFEFVSLSYEDSGKVPITNDVEKKYEYLGRVEITLIAKNGDLKKIRIEEIIKMNDDWKITTSNSYVVSILRKIGKEIEYTKIPFEKYLFFVNEWQIEALEVTKIDENNFRVNGYLIQEAIVEHNSGLAAIKIFTIYLDGNLIEEQEKIWKEKNIEYTINK